MITLTHLIDDARCYQLVRRVWVGCLYGMGLNLSNQQIAQELELDKDDRHQMTTQLRQAIVNHQPEVQLSGEVEFDEVSM